MSRDDRAVRLTTPWHGMAIGTYFSTLLLALLYATGIAEATGMAMIGTPGPLIVLWVVLLAGSALGSAAAAFLSSRAVHNPPLYRSLMVAEGVATFVLGLCLAWMFIVLCIAYGFLANPLTKAVLLGGAIGAFARSFQVLREWNVYRKASRRGVTRALTQPHRNR